MGKFCHIYCNKIEDEGFNYMLEIGNKAPDFCAPNQDDVSFDSITSAFATINLLSLS